MHDLVVHIGSCLIDNRGRIENVWLHRQYCLTFETSPRIFPPKLRGLFAIFSESIDNVLLGVSFHFEFIHNKRRDVRIKFNRRQTALHRSNADSSFHHVLRRRPNHRLRPP